MTQRIYTKMDLDYIADCVNNSCASRTWAWPHDAWNMQVLFRKFWKKTKICALGVLGFINISWAKVVPQRRLLLNHWALVSFRINVSVCLGIMAPEKLLRSMSWPVYSHQVLGQHLSIVMTFELILHRYIPTCRSARNMIFCGPC